MTTRRQPRSVRSDRWSQLAASLVAFALVAGCQAATPSPAAVDSGSPAASGSLPTQVAPSQSISAPPATPVAGTGHWEAAGTLALGRPATHAILLGSGAVLVVGDGGFDVTDASSKAEIWDPATATWKTTQGLNSPRADFAAVALKDGRALVTGGRNETDQSFSSTYVFDPGTETWTKVGLLGKARTSPAIAVLPDGRVLVAGGYFRVKPSYGSADPGAVLAAFHPPSLRATESGGPGLNDIEPPNVGAALATAELYDPATGTWSATGPMKFARFGAAAVTLTDGRVLVVGSGDTQSGVTVDDRALDTAEIFDPASGRFTPVGGLPDIDRAALDKAGVPGANPVPDGPPQFQDVGNLVASSDGGAVLIAHTGSWKHVGDITRSFRFDAGSGGWTEIGQTYVLISEPTEKTLVTLGVRALGGASVARLPGGGVLVAGGAGDSKPANRGYATFTSEAADLYDPAANSWTPVAPMPEARAGGASVVLADGSVLIIGGHAESPPAGDQVVLASAVRFAP